MAKRANLLAFTPAELEGYLKQFGEPAFRAKQILDWIYHKGAESFDNMSNVPQKLRDTLAQNATIGFLEQRNKQVSDDGTQKYLFGLSDGQCVETVLLPYDIGHSACISTQVGCKMGCMFCASGLPGFVRNLSAAEIMAQVLHVKNELTERGSHLKSLVLMGTGEPLDNFAEIVSLLNAVGDPLRLGMSLRHVTLSTSGLVPKIRELAEHKLQLNLAISLHAPNDTLRSKIMPVNKTYPIKELLAACDEYSAKTGRRITYEYILLKDVNDQDEHALQLANILKGKLSHVNLIPFNEVPELGLYPSPAETVKRFAEILRKKRINVTLRRKLGTDIAAACGQLRNKLADKKKN